MSEGMDEDLHVIYEAAGVRAVQVGGLRVLAALVRVCPEYVSEDGMKFARSALGICKRWDGTDCHVKGVCGLIAGHHGRHLEMRDGKVWADFGSGSNPPPVPAPCTGCDECNDDGEATA